MYPQKAKHLLIWSGGSSNQKNPSFDFQARNLLQVVAWVSLEFIVIVIFSSKIEPNRLANNMILIQPNSKDADGKKQRDIVARPSKRDLIRNYMQFKT